jgi:trehalose 6-phosphate phosphatase
MGEKGAMQILETSRVLDQFFGRLDGSQTGALVLDYDGTLAPFCTDRRSAFPYPGVSRALFTIMRDGCTRVNIITGRPVEEIIPLLGIFPFPEIWALHGLQHLTPDGECRTYPLSNPDLRILAEAETWLDYEGLRHLAEFKTGSIAVHWRALPEQDAVVVAERVRQAWGSLATKSRMALLEFDGGIELRPDWPNKAEAVRTIQQELEPGVPVAYLGDDRTDEEAFYVLKDSSQALTVLVRPEYQETNAKAWIKPPKELLEFLERWTDCCGGGR